MEKPNNHQPKKRFDGYEISPVVYLEDGAVEVVTDGSRFDHYSLYGHLPSGGVQCIGDFKSNTEAKKVYSLIVGDEKEKYPLSEL